MQDGRTIFIMQQAITLIASGAAAYRTKGVGEVMSELIGEAGCFDEVFREQDHCPDCSSGESVH
jgi:hypothetical protein